MIGKVVRGQRVSGLVRYLFGPGKENEHTNPHLVGGWDDDLEVLGPTVASKGRLDFRAVVDALSVPLAAVQRGYAKPVWHCALRAAPGDRVLSDGEWAEVCREVLDRTGLAARGDERGCRWVAIRHGDDHVHLVVTLARQDGKLPSTRNDFYRVREACKAVEERYGLRVTASGDRTADRRPKRAEHEKAQRQGRQETVRDTLRREVQVAAAGAHGEDEFFERLEDLGVHVRKRMSTAIEGEVTGYSVAWPEHRNRDGQLIWYGGGKLASDLTLPKLRARWVHGPGVSAPGRQRPRSDRPGAGRDSGAGERRWPPRGVPLGPEGRRRAWEDAARAAGQAAEVIRLQAGTDPEAAADAAHAAADVLASAARALEGGYRKGALAACSDTFNRSARELHGRTPRPSPAGLALRQSAVVLAMLGRATHQEAAVLLGSLVGLTSAVAELRQAQQRLAQSQAALDAARQLQTISAAATAPGWRPTPGDGRRPSFGPRHDPRGPQR